MNYVTPVGFRDVMSDEAEVREDLTRRVQDRFAGAGYRPLETPTLEVLDVMQAGGRIAQAPFKFFDAQGDLLAMRPDVTMQVARMCATRLRGALNQGDASFKFRYTQRVFREQDAQADACELTQVGIEKIGEGGVDADVEVIRLFMEALDDTGLTEYCVAMGSARVVRDLLEVSGAPASWQQAVLRAYHTSNMVDLQTLTQDDSAMPLVAQALLALPKLRGGAEAIDAVREICAPLNCAAGVDELEAVYQALAADGFADKLLLDFSVISSFDYYTGIVFEAYSPGMGDPLGSGGRYDNLLATYGAPSTPAAGFAFSLEQVMVAYREQRNPKRPLRIAVPKGSLGPDSIRVLEEAGLDVTGLADAGRTLMLSNGDVEYIIVRPTDAPVFVAMGAADCGICGEDSLVEAAPDVVELVDLKFGGCRFVVAESAGSTPEVEKRYRQLGSIRVASKYPNITRAHFDRIGMQVEVIKLHGNVELAPITGMAERIVDITATGTTLRENNLEIVEDVLDSTARFFANPVSFRTNPRVAELANALERNVK